MATGKGSQEWASTLVLQVQTNSRLFYRVAYRILRDPGAAEDVCQQAFLKAWSVQESIKDAVALQAWLMRVVVNESLQVLRQRKIRLRDAQSEQAKGDVRFSSLEHEEFREQFHQVLEELPAPTQTVVMLRLVEGLSGNEVKNLLGCSPSEVSRRLHQGLDHLRERLGSSYADGKLL